MTADRTPPDAARATVWVVEDSALEAEVVREALSGSYDVALYGSGETMLEELATEPAPDVVVLDWHLPGLSGLELCRFLRANPATLALPVLLLTASATSADVIQGFAVGADDYLAKPYLPAELSARVAALVRGRQLRRRSERAEHSLRTLLEHLPDGLLALDGRGAITFANAEAERILARPLDTLMGRPLAAVLPGLALPAPPVEPTDTPTALDDVTIGDRIFAPVLRALGGATATGRVLVLRDITARKRYERALDFIAQASIALASSLDSAGTFARLVSLAVPALGDWCAVHVANGRGALELAAIAHVTPGHAAQIRAANASAPAAVNGGHPAARFLASGRAELLADASAMLHPTAPADGDAAPVAGGAGITVPLVLSSGPPGAITFGAGTSARVYDATDLRLAEELARRAAVALENARLYELAQRERTRVEEANRAKDEFLAMVSHELRTPLNAMLGWTRMLRTGSLPAEKRERALETIERNARAQTQLIEDLLDVSRIITGKLRLDVQPLDLAPVIEAALEAVRPAAAAKGIRLRPDLDPSAGGIMGDADRLEQVVWNLLTNAIKFTPRGGEVHVSLRARGEHAEISVVDTGQGIPADFLPYVFERFRQADGGVARTHGGLGLGLSIVKHLVELHGGTIEATSAGDGRGASFVVAVPRRIADEGSPHSPAPRLAPSGVLAGAAALAGLRVLVVEDEADARELLVSVLEHCGVAVTAAPDVRSALENFDRAPPDVLVSDIGMPGQDGYALIRAVRARSRESGGRTPAVALTAFARAEDRTRALAAGFDLHVAKPIEPAVLVSVIAQLAARALPA